MRRPGAAGLALVLMLGALGGFTGCGTAPEKPKDYTPELARFFLESAARDATPVTLPQSGVRLGVQSSPVLTEGDIVNVEVMQVELGKCVMFQLTSSAARDLYRFSVTNQGRRLVLFLNGTPLGARRIDGPFAEGNVLIFVEVPDAELPKLVENLKKTTADLQKAIARKK